jgi:hypothetical protein
MIKEAGQKLDEDVAEARRDLTTRSQMLAMQIVETLAAKGAR